MLNPINLNPEKVETITLACLALHNFLASENWKTYTEIDEEFKVMCSNKLSNQAGNRTTARAIKIRDEFKEYFNSDCGTVPWQADAVYKHNV